MLRRIHFSGRHVSSVTLMREASSLLSDPRLADRPCEYLIRFKRFERDVIVAIAGFIGARPICTLWDLGQFVCAAVGFETWEALKVTR